LQYDSLKVAMNIYLRQLKQTDILQSDMDIIMQSIKTSEKLHEIKFFFLHQHFDLMSIAQLNQLIDILMEILNVKDIKKNPAIH